MIQALDSVACFFSKKNFYHKASTSSPTETNKVERFFTGSERIVKKLPIKLPHGHQQQQPNPRGTGWMSFYCSSSLSPCVCGDKILFYFFFFGRSIAHPLNYNFVFGNFHSPCAHEVCALVKEISLKLVGSFNFGFTKFSFAF